MTETANGVQTQVLTVVCVDSHGTRSPAEEHRG
jgi:hypothetical protein